MARYTWWGLCLVAGWAIASGALARRFHDVDLPEQTKIHADTLKLNGMGVREETVFNVDVYVAGLYLDAPSRNAQAILAADRPRRLVAVFVRNVSQAKAKGALRKALDQSAGKKLPSVLHEAGAFESWLPAFAKGDHLALTYVPGDGLYIEGPGRAPLHIAGKAFADVMFGIWIGPRCVDPALREGLLGAH